MERTPFGFLLTLKSVGYELYVNVIERLGYRKEGTRF